MAENPGSEVLFLDEDGELAISSGSVSTGEDVVLYGPDIARGGSNPSVDQDALLISDSQAQTGPGITAKVVISDSQGESEGTVVLTTRDQDPADYCGYGSAGNNAVSGSISDEILEVGVTSFLLYVDDTTGERFFGFFHDKYSESDGNFGGEVDWDVSGIPDGASTVVEDDPESDTPVDSYDLSSGHIENEWGDPNTDGVLIGTDDNGSVNDAPSNGFTAGELDGVTVTFDCVKFGPYPPDDGGPPEKIRFVGDEGTTVERSWDGTNTSVQITF